MELNDHSQLILASASPRRKELLRLLGIPYEVIPAAGEEQAVSARPWETVERLSAQKAREVARSNPDCRVLGADTVVAFGEDIFGKPADEQDAYRMLRRLQGNTHQVYTGVTLCKINRDGKEEIHTFHEKTDVDVYPMNDREIWTYIRTGEPMDKAGAYGIQGSFCLYVKGIRGDYQNVVGLPVSRLYSEMKKLGLIEGYACAEDAETYSGCGTIIEETMKNIKLICSDVDGTLVPDGTSELNTELYDIIVRLKEKGIHFAAASGRQVISLEKLFAPIRDQIFYLAENGAYIGCYGRELFTRPMDGQDIKGMIRDIHEHMPECDIMLSGPRKAYTDSRNPVFLKFLLEGYRYALDEVKALENLEGSFIKLAVYREDIPREYLEFLKDRWGAKYKIVTSGDMWIDILDIHANKGLAVKELQESLSVTPEETMVFGDQQNDIEMLKQAYYSYAVANALPETQAAARFITDSSTNDGVLKVLKELLIAISGEGDAVCVR